MLGHCLRDLRWNQSHPRSTQRMPPFRESRITMLFRDYLSGGRGQTTVIAAVSPRADDRAASGIRSLGFGGRIRSSLRKVSPAEPSPPALPLIVWAELGLTAQDLDVAGCGVALS